MPDPNSSPPVATGGDSEPRSAKPWASLAHFGGLLGIFPSLVIFLALRHQSGATRRESREALNWQITTAMYGVFLVILAGGAAVVLGNVLLRYCAYICLGTLVPTLPLLALYGLWMVNCVFSIMGGVKVNGGGSYRYPFALRLVK